MAKANLISTKILFFFIVYVILVIKFVTLQNVNNDLLFSLYSLAVAFYILSRFALAYFYDPEKGNFDPHYVPTVTFAVPSKNEGENIRETLLRIADSDYPKSKFDIIAVNDGSTDNTLDEMLATKKIAKRAGVNIHVVHWEKNRGKRDGMAECVIRSKSELVIFIDSDSFVDKNTARELVKYFIDKKVAAVAAHGYVANANVNALTKMQAVRYYVAFKAYKGTEALFRSVTCCSGCGSAYRRSHMLEVLNKWKNQKFLGVRCTYGDDRSLTNYLLQKGYSALYAPEAKVYTIVPENFRQFMKQQLRWKKSWVRESFRAGIFMWKRNPIISLIFYLGIILPLLAPIIVIRAMFWYPYLTGIPPYSYLIGLGLMSLAYGLYYYAHTNDKNWFYGVLFATFYTLVLVWQLPYAIINMRDASWGTR